MRVQPKAWIAFVLFVLYAVIVSAVWAVNGLDYDGVAETRSTIVEGIVVPIAFGAVFLAIAATVLGWWRPAMVEDHRAGPRWGWVLPAMLFLAVILSISGIDFGAADGSALVMLAIGCALVGFSEELLTRGLMIVGFRGSLSEPWVWFLSSLMFGLLHGLNVFFGQSLAATVRQIVFAFLLGTAFYVTRRITGMLVVTMVIHALWDFGTLGVDHSGADAPALAGLMIWPIVIVALVLLVSILRQPSREGAVAV